MVELYLPGSQAGRLADLAAAANAAAAALATDGAGIRYVRAVFVPADEMCFMFFEAASRELLSRAVARARLPVERTLEAVEHAPAV